MIYGKRIRFRAVEREDLPTFVRWLNDPEVQQGIMIYRPLSQAQEENWFEAMIKKPVEEQVMGIEVKALPDESGVQNWKIIGSIAFTDVSWRNRSAQFGILIGEKSYWGQGYGTEAVRLLAEHGFNTLNLNRIFLHVFENNPRAIRAYEKAGFTQEGRMRQAEFRHGKYLDVLIMSLLRDDF